MYAEESLWLAIN